MRQRYTPLQDRFRGSLDGFRPILRHGLFYARTDRLITVMEPPLASRANLTYSTDYLDLVMILLVVL
jgi:hypothetical protein